MILIGGVKNIYIACVDGVIGFADAIPKHASRRQSLQAGEPVQCAASFVLSIWLEIL